MSVVGLIVVLSVVFFRSGFRSLLSSLLCFISIFDYRIRSNYRTKFFQKYWKKNLVIKYPSNKGTL